MKYENVYISGYQTIPEARSGLGNFFSSYNDERLHESLDYNTPAEVYSGKEWKLSEQLYLEGVKPLGARAAGTIII